MKPIGILVIRCNEHAVSHHYLLYSDKTGTELFYVCYYGANDRPKILDVGVFIKEIKNHIIIKKQPYTELVNHIMCNYAQSSRRLELESYLTT